MSAKKDTIWPAEPHTFAKTAILKNYLFPYFYMLGSSFSDEILYVDGFAGPGVYLNGNGSPVEALIAASKVLIGSKEKMKTLGITAAFIEKDTRRFATLQENIEPFKETPKLKLLPFNGEFADRLADIKESVPSAFSSTPAFFFIDPFGTKGLPFDTIREILKNPKSEVLLNFNAPGVSRIWSAGESAKREKNLDSLFGDRESWINVLGGNLSPEARARKSHELYKTKLKQIPGVKFVYAYEMRDKSDNTSYFLLFASHHFQGLEKMKGAMKSTNIEGAFIFSDAHENQHEMFSANDPIFYADQMHKLFSDKIISYETLRDYSLNETPFSNPKSMLKALEIKSNITVSVQHGSRKKNTYNEDLGLTIFFKPYVTNLFD